jgi:hypothetical protein
MYNRILLIISFKKRQGCFLFLVFRGQVIVCNKKAEPLLTPLRFDYVEILYTMLFYASVRTSQDLKGRRRGEEWLMALERGQLEF